MKCLKCKGLMVQEEFSDYFFLFFAWKCINCGAIVDPTITRNQRMYPAADVPEPVSR